MLNFSLDKQKLIKLGELHAKEYQCSNPYPNIAIDNFFPENILDQILEEFPGTKNKGWQTFENKHELKLASKGEDQFGPKSKNFFHLLNSEPFLQFLETITGIPNLIPDPHFVGGGFHQIVRGGFLKIHADFNKHPKTDLDRRLNVLIYLNKDWKEEYGGYFELWDKDMKGSVKKILPLYNRLVIFSTTSDSYHGHPDPLNCPEGSTRKSIALYYYTNRRPEEEINKGMENHSTLFRERPGEIMTYKRSFFFYLKEAAKLITPPIFIVTLRKVLKQLKH